MSSNHFALLDVDPAAVIDKDSPVPLHYQLELFLRQALDDGRILPGQTLPTELELQEFFGLSRTPIRQALARLSADGLIDRKRSHGTIVLPKLFEESLSSLTTFTQEVEQRGLTPSCRLLDFKIVAADADDRKHLALSQAEDIFHVRRLRAVDGNPIGVWISHIPVRIVSALQAGDFNETGPRQSMYYVLEQVHGIKLVRASESFRAVSLDPEFARLLNIPAYTAALLRARVSFDPAGRAIAYEQALYRGVYHLEWNGRAISAIETRGFSEEQVTAKTD